MHDKEWVTLSISVRIGILLFLFDSFDSDSLITDENTLQMMSVSLQWGHDLTTYFAFIRFWWSPLANPCSKQTQLMLIRATQDDFRRVRDLCLDVFGHGHDDGMAKAKLHVEPHPAHPNALSPGICFQRSTISDSDEVKRYRKALCHARDRVLDERSRETPHGALFLDLRIFHAES